MNSPLQAPETSPRRIRPLPDFKAAVPLLVAQEGRERTGIRGYQVGQLIRFAEASQPIVSAGTGWFEAETWGRWSAAKAKLAMKLDPNEGQREDLALAAVLHLPEAGTHPKEVAIWANGIQLTRFLVPAADPRPRFIRCLLPRPGTQLTLEFEFPDAAPPGEHDTRRLGGGFQWLSIDRATDAIDHVPDEAIPVLISRDRPHSRDDAPDGSDTGEDGAWAGRVPHHFSMPSPDVAEDSVALLLLVDLPSDPSTSDLAIDVDGQAFDHRVEPGDRRSLALRIGPLTNAARASRAVSVRGGKGVRVRFARLVGWRDRLPPHFDRPDLTEILPTPSGLTEPHDASPEAVVALLKLWHRETVAEARRLGAGLAEVQAVQESSVREWHDAFAARLAGLEKSFDDMLRQQALLIARQQDFAGMLERLRGDDHK